jgi:hypothetical protein
MICSTKTCQIKKNRRISTKNTNLLKSKKTQKSSTFTHGFERGAQGKEPRRFHAYIPNQIPKRKALNPPQEKHQEKASKITKKGKRGKQH